MDLTKEILLKRHAEAQWNTAGAREMARCLIEFYDQYAHRKRKAHFRGMMLTLGQVFTEDNPALHMLLTRPKGEPVPTIDASRLVRGAIGQGTAPEKPPKKLEGVRVFKMSQIRAMRKTREELEEECPDLESLRAFTREHGLSLPPNFKHYKKAVSYVLDQMQAAQV